MEPEKAHDLVLESTSKFFLFSTLIGRKSNNDKFKLKVGNNFWQFPVGLAAGLDKNATAIDFFKNIGFGAVEVGTVTPHPQAGNEKPRLFRLLKEKSLRNKMGFNNFGEKIFLHNLKRYKRDETPIGVNIGKNKMTLKENSEEDYYRLYTLFNKQTDYLVINVSSPNTPGLRELQTKDFLRKVLSGLNRKSGDSDLFIKISPDISDEIIYGVVDLVKEYNVTGIIATNTSIIEKYGSGGISGELLYQKSNKIRKKCLEALKEAPEIDLIGVGGFSTFEEMKNYWRIGGRALQIYSSFIYQGPQILIDIETKIKNDFSHYGASNFEEYLLALKN